MNSKERRDARYIRRKNKREEKKAEKLNLYSFENVFSFTNLSKSLHECCKGTGWKTAVQKYKINGGYNLNSLHKKIISRQHEMSRPRKFRKCERGKLRDITSLDIEDRVVQRCLCDNFLLPILTPTLIYDNSACLKNRGVHFAKKRIKSHLKRLERDCKLCNIKSMGYFLQFDFSKYFSSINHSKLFENVLNDIAVSDNMLYILRSQLKYDIGGVGIGLGSQSSQIYALSLPRKLDNCIQESCISGYTRYMDDGIIFSPYKEILEEILVDIKILCYKLGINLNYKKTQIGKIENGFNFLKTKYSITDNYKIITKPNRISIKKARKKIKIFSDKKRIGDMQQKEIWEALQSIGAYLKTFNSYNTRKSLNEYYKNFILIGDNNKK